MAKWSKAQYEKFYKTLEAKKFAKAFKDFQASPEADQPVKLEPIQLTGDYHPPSDPIQVDIQSLADRKLSEVIQAAEVLGLHVEIHIVRNGSA